MKPLFIFLTLFILMSCTRKSSSTQAEFEYDTLGVIQAMLRDSAVLSLLHNRETELKYRDSVYFVRTGLSDSILSKIKIANRRVGFLPMPKERPYHFGSITNKQVIWFRLLKLDRVVALGEVYISGYNLIHEIQMRRANKKWVVEKTDVSHF